MPRIHILIYTLVAIAVICNIFSSVSPWWAAFALFVGGIIGGWDLHAYQERRNK